MNALLTPEIKAWIGRSEPPYREEITRRDIIKYAVATEQRLPKYLNGDEAPPMFLSGIFRRVVPLDELGPDGIAAQSLLPELPLKRIMAGGTEMEIYRAVKPGDVLLGTRTLVDIYEKSGSQGPLIFIVYELNVTTENGEPVMKERTTRIVR
jgi:hydroxyacyl-ACP dehydratase HTD2-like protein with hotdog domain